MNKYFKNNKIDFIVIGVQKGGTSALDSYLRRHKSVQMANVKEVHFFDDDEVFKSEKIDYNFYHKFFKKTFKKKIYGEVTPIYIYWEKSIKRIYNYNNNIKLILILRNPIDRAYSHWNMEFLRNTESRSFESCINERNKERRQHRVFSYVERGYYASQIENVLRYFNQDQVLFLKYEDFLGNQEENLKRVFEFLDVDTHLFQYEFAIRHQLEYENKLSVNSKKYLLEIYKDDIIKVERLLNWNCNDWKK